jgi:hypothetical protein
MAFLKSSDLGIKFIRSEAADGFPRRPNFENVGGSFRKRLRPHLGTDNPGRKIVLRYFPINHSIHHSCIVGEKQKREGSLKCLDCRLKVKVAYGGFVPDLSILDR